MARLQPLAQLCLMETPSFYKGHGQSGPVKTASRPQPTSFTRGLLGASPVPAWVMVWSTAPILLQVRRASFLS